MDQEKPAATTQLPAVSPSSPAKRKSERGRGRPSKLTPELQEHILLSLRAGMYYETACAFAGIDRSTRVRWLQKGRAALEKGRWSNVHAQFCIACERAMAETEVRDLQLIGKVGHGCEAKYDDKGNLVRPYAPPVWQAVAWRLERRFPERYALRTTTKLVGDRENPIPVESSGSKAVDELDRIRSILGVLAEAGVIPAEAVDTPQEADDAEIDEVHPPSSVPEAGGVSST